MGPSKRMIWVGGNVQVQRLLPFGMLVVCDDGRSGLIRTREIAWDDDGRQHWRERFKAGDQLQAVPLAHSHDQFAELSLRLAQYDPWADLRVRYRQGQIITGVVAETYPDRIMLEIETGVWGLLPYSALPDWFQSNDLENVFWPGDRVYARIESFDLKRRAVQVSLSQAWPQPGAEREQYATAAPTAAFLREVSPDHGVLRQLLDRLLDQMLPRCVLVVDADQPQRAALVTWLQQVGQITLIAASLEAALDLIENEHPDLVFMRLNPVDTHRMLAIRQVHARWPAVQCVLITDWPSVAADLDGSEELAGMGMSLLIEPWSSEDLVQVLATGSAVSGHSNEQVSAGAPETVAAQRTQTMQLLAHERQQFREAATMLQRLAVLGQLSRGLIHDIHHLLSPITFALYDLEIQCKQIEQLADESPGAVEAANVRQARETLALLVQGVRRLTETTRLYSRVTIRDQEQLVYLSMLVEEVVNLVRDTADRAHVHIDVQASPEPLATRTQAGHVRQMLLNIVLNAIQHIAQARSVTSGNIRIWTVQAQRGDSAVLQINVGDDGPGIHRRLWEPVFAMGFTTRPQEHSGMGLYITRSVAEMLGGRVYVAESAVLGGTRCVIELPLKL